MPPSSLVKTWIKVLTPTVGETPVAGGAAGAVSANNMGTAGTLASEGLTGRVGGPHFMAAARPSPIVVEEGQGGGGITAELG